MKPKNPFEHRGSKPFYDEKNHPRIAYEFMVAGGTQVRLAKALGIHESTLYDWINKYKLFAESVQRGKDDFDVGQVEGALLKRALGWEYFESEYSVPSVRFAKNVKSAEIKSLLKTIKPMLVKQVTRVVPPSDSAIQFFLKNRAPARWPKSAPVVESTNVMYLTSDDIKRMLSEEDDSLKDKQLPPIKTKEKDHEERRRKQKTRQPSGQTSASRGKAI